MTTLRCKRNIQGIINREEGEMIEYHPWQYIFQDMTEPERIEKGIYVHCFGMGEFEILKVGEDVEIAAPSGEPKAMDCPRYREAVETAARSLCQTIDRAMLEKLTTESNR